jgi:hypothetical protein
LVHLHFAVGSMYCDQQASLTAKWKPNSFGVGFQLVQTTSHFAVGNMYCDQQASFTAKWKPNSFGVGFQLV